ncbi:hypothetical protein LINGRAHAP2_LOCUS10636 [Linum grandiflorum]
MLPQLSDFRVVIRLGKVDTISANIDGDIRLLSPQGKKLFKQISKTLKRSRIQEDIAQKEVEFLDVTSSTAYVQFDPLDALGRRLICYRRTSSADDGRNQMELQSGSGFV